MTAAQTIRSASVAPTLLVGLEGLALPPEPPRSAHVAAVLLVPPESLVMQVCASVAPQPLVTQERLAIPPEPSRSASVVPIQRVVRERLVILRMQMHRLASVARILSVAPQRHALTVHAHVVPLDKLVVLDKRVTPRPVPAVDESAGYVHPD